MASALNNAEMFICHLTKKPKKNTVHTRVMDDFLKTIFRLKIEGVM